MATITCCDICGNSIDYYFPRDYPGQFYLYKDGEICGTALVKFKSAGMDDPHVCHKCMIDSIMQYIERKIINKESEKEEDKNRIIEACPYCDSYKGVDVDTNSSSYSVDCSECGLTGPSSQFKHIAILSWNNLRYSDE